MANELIKQNYKNIANAIRAKTGKNGTLTAEEMPTEINTELAKKPTGTKSITANADNIDVKDYAAVNVNVPNPSTGTLEITENGEGINVTDYAYVDVDVSGGVELQADSVYRTDESGNPTVYESFGYYNVYYGGSNTASDLQSKDMSTSGQIVYFCDGEMNDLVLSESEVAYRNNGTDEITKTDLSNGKFAYFDDSYGEGNIEIEEMSSDNDIAWWQYGSYKGTQSIHTGNFYYAGGCNSLFDDISINGNTVYIWDTYMGSDNGGLHGVALDGSDSFNLLYYNSAGCDFICEGFTLPEVGESTTVTISGLSFSGEFQITRLS